jgi:hypothetical protein
LHGLPFAWDAASESNRGVVDRDDLSQAVEVWVHLHRLEHFDAAIIARALSIQERLELRATISRVRSWLIGLETAVNDDAAIVKDYLGA